MGFVVAFRTHIPLSDFRPIIGAESVPYFEADDVGAPASAFAISRSNWAGDFVLRGIRQW